jgi:predicted Zn-dependent peptidase
MSKKQIYKLPNQLRISVDEMKEVETVSIGVFVNTGSRNENLKINGISHFLEHMAFKGTKKRSAKQIAEEFEGIGGYINAYTSKEKTVYYTKVLKQHAEFAVEFLSDILQNSTFDNKELEKERGVILQEIAMTNDSPDDIIFDYFQSTAYGNQSLGQSILGSPENIKKFSRENFINYINDQYNYRDIAIVGSGSIKEGNLVKWSEKYFNNLGKNKIKPLEINKYKGGELLKEKKLEQVNLIIGFDGLSYNHQDYYKIQVLAMILGGGMSSRLFQEIRENQGLAYSIYAFNYSFQDSGLFGIYAGTTPDKSNQLINSVKEQINKICKKIDKSELDRVKTQFQAGLLMSKESTSSRMQKLGSDIISYNKIISDKEIISKIRKITEKEISQLASKIFINTKTTFSAIGNVKNIKSFSKIN